jgi:DNA processing protein
MSQELIFQLALSLIKVVGPINTKKLIAYCGSPEAAFKEKIANLKKIPTIGNVLAKEIQNSNVSIKLS